MARALGMNAKKLPGLRPGPRQGWKLPVGEFIEAFHPKRFGGHPLDHHQHRPEPGSQQLPIPQRDMDACKRVTEAASQLEDLICYLMNLADDLQTWLALVPKCCRRSAWNCEKSRRRLRPESRYHRSQRFPFRPAPVVTRCQGRAIRSVRPTKSSPSDLPRGRSCVSETRTCPPEIVHPSV